MDERRLLKTRRKIRFRFRALGSALISPLAFSACFTSEPPTLPRVNGEVFSQLAKDISALRELRLKHDLALDTKTLEPPATASIADHGAMTVAALEGAYKSVGLLPGDVDLGSAQADYRRAERLAAYRETGSQVWLSPNLARVSRALEKPYPATAFEAPAIFGIVAALQEQHFRWQARIDALSLEDRRLAFRAVSAGDLALTISLRAAGAAKGQLAPVNAQVAGAIARELDLLGGRLPTFFRQKLGFPYAEGSRFVLWAYRARGWSGVNALYAQPPLSTAEILHPEKYFVRRQLPLRFFPPALLRRYRQGPAVEQSFGESLIRGLLTEAHGAANASRWAAAWRGDQLFSFQDGSDITTTWFSAWGSDGAAEQFLDAYRSVLERRHRLRFERAANVGRRTLRATARDGRGWLLQTRGSTVVLVHTGPKESLTDLAAQAWQDLEIEPEATAISFETARRRIQLEFRS